MKTMLTLAALALASGTAMHPAYAAHAGAPYQNVDKRNDAGNDTGDSQTDQLNAAQLNQGATPAPSQPIAPTDAPKGGRRVGAH